MSEWMMCRFEDWLRGSEMKKNLQMTMNVNFSSRVSSLLTGDTQILARLAGWPVTRLRPLWWYFEPDANARFRIVKQHLVLALRINCSDPQGIKLREFQKCRLRRQYTGKGGVGFVYEGIWKLKMSGISWYSWTVLVLHVLAILYDGAFTKDVWEA